MITAKDAISTAMDLLGTPYSDLDCINFIKRIIRTAPGGDPKYTDAHVPALWASYDSSPKYRHLSARWTNIDNLKPGRLVFKGKPLGRDHEPSHVGMYIGNGQVIHSSSAKGCVVITDVGNGQWTLSADSVMIQTGEDEGGGGTDPILYQARVITQRDSLRMRTGPGTSYSVIGSVPKGAIVGVLAEPDPEWDYISYQGRTGYASAQYLERVDPEPQPAPQPDQTTSGVCPGTPLTEDIEPCFTLTTLMDDEGHYVTLLGHWRVVED